MRPEGFGACRWLLLAFACLGCCCLAAILAMVT